MKKIGFVCLAGLDNFIDDIIEDLSNDYNVRKFIIRDQQEIYNAIDWSDIVWLEWANQVAIVGTNYEKIKGKKVILRLHAYESLSDMPRQINWDSVNRLILVATNIQNIMKTTMPDIEKKVRIKLIHNGINLNRFKFGEREPGYNIAWIGFINHKKNPPMALQILKKLTDSDERYKLHIAGHSQDMKYDLYLDYMAKEMGIFDNINWYGQVDDINDFLQDKNYLLHTSILEGYGYVIMEAMAKGIKPVIHNFFEAKNFYPKKYLYNTIDEAAINIADVHNYNSKEYREWLIKEGLTLGDQMKQIRKVIKEI